MTMIKTTEDEQRKNNMGEVGGMGSGVINWVKTTEGMWWLSMEGIGIYGTFR